MTTCPLCGSSGDDLVFRFYCSNKNCGNYVEQGNREQKDIQDRVAPKIDLPMFTQANWSTGLPSWHCNENEDSLDVLAATVYAKKYFCQRPQPIKFPSFSLMLEGDKVGILWRDKVPHFLTSAIEAIANNKGHKGQYQGSFGQRQRIEESLRDLIVPNFIV